jgi:5'-3' exonuclease
VFGEITLSPNRNSIKGEGLLFFYSQCLTGDKVDSIPGLEGCGPIKAFEILDGCVDSQDAFNRVLEAYRGVYGDKAEEELLEQGRLLWMTRELHPDGSPVLWEFPNKQENIQ